MIDLPDNSLPEVPDEVILEYFKELNKNLRSTYDLIYPKHIQFIITYLYKKNNHRAKISQLVLNLNKIRYNLNDLDDDHEFGASLNDKYRILRKTHKYYKLELTESGINLAELLKYNDRIIIYDGFLQFVVFLSRVIRDIFKLILRLIELFIDFLEYTIIKHPVQTLTVIGLIIGIIVGIFELMEYLNS